MLNRLSGKYQKEIALSFIALFFTSGLNLLKAQILSGSNQVAYRHKPVSFESGRGDRAHFPSMGFRKLEESKLPTPAETKKPAPVATTPQAVQQFGKPFIGGPSQPEMGAFKPVGTDNMVSPFTGDFSYNIPLLDVGGYPVNMFYSSGITMDQESSWLGLGWNINPGTITRNMRGLPDDFDGSDKITKTQSFRDDKTFGVTGSPNIRFFGFPMSVGATTGLSWNNKLGVAAEAGINAALRIGGKSGDPKTTELSFSAGLNASSRSGASFSPGVKISQLQNNSVNGSSSSLGVGYTYSSRMGLTQMHLDMNSSKLGTNDDGEQYSNPLMGHSGTLSFAYPSVTPSITKPLTRMNFSVDLSLGGEMTGAYANGKLHGYYSQAYIDEKDQISTHAAYGMLNLEKGKDNPEALLDFNRANDGVYTPNSPSIAMPIYTYDVFSINGEGTGGSFRAYRGDVGHVTDAYVKTRENNGGIGVDIGFGNLVHVGADLNYIYSPTDAGDWKLNNLAAPAFSFQKSDGNYQASYFKNPGEKTVPDQVFQSAIANEDLVRLKMINVTSGTPTLLPTLLRYDGNKNLLGEKYISLANTKKVRDKRTQVISFLTAEESEHIGMNTKLYSYNAEGGNANRIIFSADCERSGIDSFYRNHDGEHGKLTYPKEDAVLGGEITPFRHKNHISEIDVLGSDGKKYVYGLPVYNKKQTNVTFSVNKSQATSDTKVTYDPGDNTTDNDKGRDWFMEKEEIPAYTHSYLLTALTSPNYVDVTGNGVTDDDMGDAVKFNYSKYKDFNWRTPIGTKSGSYYEGLKTDEKDDKAHYVYGERESWYLYSVESKNMVARFFVKNDRKDGRSVTDEDGGLDNTNGMQRLDKICLYSKGQLAKDGNSARPIKTIRFFQSYKLTPNVDNNSGLCVDKNGNTVACGSESNTNLNKGKLTLDSVWISYNGNDLKPKSKYVFYYPANTNNPSYSFESSDRWGTYKPKTDNPNSTTPIPNSEYPYSVQDKVKANKNAAAWTMNKILLPSGAVINIDYESDSYAYVQNKKASNMFQVLGFGDSKLADLNSLEKVRLYKKSGNDFSFNDYVFVQLSSPVTNDNDFTSRYIGTNTQLYLKLAVEMPAGRGVSGIAGYELIPVYADIESSGRVSDYIGWIKVRRVVGEHNPTPMAQSALQFLVQQLPGKAYKNYDLSESGGMRAIVLALGGMLSAASAMFTGEMNKLMDAHKCEKVVLANSFARLQNPVGEKFGGGLRVKKIVISDNWNKMTRSTPSATDGMINATYGQEYFYTTTEKINGVATTISSGVASWEPSIGGDENPHREIMRYINHNKGGPYEYGSIELPLGESFYPSPSVGYSRVEIVSIHRDTVKNLPTRSVTEFYTNKEFPYRSTATDLTADANVKYEPSHILQLLKIDMMKSVTQSQGFLVETNDMNGKVKSQATYSATDNNTPVSYTENFYNTRQATDKTYTFNHVFPTIGAADGKVTDAVIGRDIELMTDFRQHHSETITANLSINFDAFALGFLPIPVNNLLQPVVREGMMYRSASVLKTVTHFGILDSVVVIEKGSMVSTKNLLYDAESGNPLLTRTQNEHNQPIYNFSYPAHWAYSGMGPAYKNIDAVYTGLNFAHGILTNPPAGIFDVLESGDEIYVVSNRKESLPLSLPCDAGLSSTPPDPWTTLAPSTVHRIWAVNTGKTGDGSNKFVFMDASGNPFNAFGDKGIGADIRIVRSGKRNLMDQSAGSIVSLVDPRVTTTVGNVSTTKVAFTSDITQASAATFKDNWRVDNDFYKIKETVTDSLRALVKKQDIMPSDHVNIRWQHEWRTNNNPSYQVDLAKEISFDPSMPLYKKTYLYHANGGKGYRWEDRKMSFLLYNYNVIPSNAIFYKAMLSAFSHSNGTMFPTSIFPSSNHPGLHGTTTSQNNVLRLGEVAALNKNWYGVTPPLAPSADPWITNYLKSPGITTGKGVIPYPSGAISDNYSLVNGGQDTRINVTLPIRTNAGSILANQKLVGLKVSLDVDDIGTPDNVPFYRCFWSPRAMYPCPTFTRTGADSSFSNATIPPQTGCYFATPVLSYYYYVWGDMVPQSVYPPDPIVNTLVKKYLGTVTGIFCRSKFTEKKSMNPYVEGVLGNWRVDSTYAYYGARKESDATQSIDTRTAGVISGYKTFWTFAATPGNPSTPVYMSRNFAASDVWVWNSAITQYNRKGYEIENTDPLGRFNSGLYGYYQQLPVAVANNSRVREMMYDGFEDYDYQNSGCADCAPRRSVKYDVIVNNNITTTQSHTGKYSLIVANGQSVKITAPVVTVPVNDAYGLKIKSTTINDQNLWLGTGGVAGTGLNAMFYNHSVSGQPNVACEPGGSNSELIITKTSMPINIPANSTSLSPAVGVSPNYFSVKFIGKIQAPATGTYYFKSVSDNGYRLTIGGTQLSSNAAWNSQLNVGGNGWGNGNEIAPNGYTMNAGTTYTIEVDFYNQWGPYQFDLQWKTPMNANNFVPIPVNYLYGPNATAFQQVISQQTLCNRLDSVQVTGAALTDTLSLLQTKRMVLSAWVKVGTANCCFPPTYADNGITANRTNSITLSYNGGGTVATFQPAGNIIEGWQRYESDFTIPTTATSVTLSLNNTTASSMVFFDDIRLHPYNANMKSFAYNSDNLRLMAELDENNYASFYEYDDDGTLTRVKKETQRGIKTIKETRSATQKNIQNED